MTSLKLLNFKRKTLAKGFALATAMAYACTSFAQIDYSKIEYDIVIFDAETIARLNAPKTVTPSAAQTGTSASSVTQSTPPPAPSQATPTDSTLTTLQTNTSPVTTPPAPSVASVPSTDVVPVEQSSPFPRDISSEFIEVISGVPIMQDPQSCGKGLLEIGVTLDKVPNSKGTIVADLHDDVKENFLVWDKVVLRVRATAVEGITKFCIPLTKPGDYAIAVYHDKNGNKEFDKNFLGIPSERFGMSNNPKFGLKSPEYEEAVFSVPASGTDINITLFKAGDILKARKKEDK